MNIRSVNASYKNAILTPNIIKANNQIMVEAMQPYAEMKSCAHIVKEIRFDMATDR